ncbi:MAG TPA: hypothetical protein DCW44_02230 [Eubacterium sp.]|nr:hypothetical protein [Eubacterium sp.]
MSVLKAYGEEVNSVFQLLGTKENDITKSIAWTMKKCPCFMKNIISEVFDLEINSEEVLILFQNYDSKAGITDIEIFDNESFHIIIEAKRGWLLPGSEQLTKYSLREEFVKSKVPNKAIISMSECSVEYAKLNLPFLEVKDIPIKHLSWKRIDEIIDLSRNTSNNEQKKLLEQLKIYLQGVMSMQNKDSNWVYVVSLANKKLDESCDLTWLDIVNKYNRYFHPVGGGNGGWPKEPPNYIAFRYNGKLQTIHHIEDYVISKTPKSEIPEMPDWEWEDNHFIYKLGPAIIPIKEVKTGNIYPSGRVWAMLDTLLTADTISEARDISYSRK